MTNVEMFSNGEFELTVTHVGNTFRVNATGLAKALAFHSAWEVVRNLADDEKGSASERTPGGIQQVWHVTEPGFYRVVGQRQPGRIKNPEARARVERFQRWLHHEVLPALRRHGTYTIPTQRTAEGDLFVPHTLTWDEVAALFRQRYGLPVSVVELTRMLRTAGVLKQNGSPRKPYQNMFWFTGSSWNVHPHVIPQLVQKAVDTARELQQFRFIQAQLELDGVGSLRYIDGDTKRGLGAA